MPRAMLTQGGDGASSLPDTKRVLDQFVEMASQGFQVRPVGHGLKLRGAKWFTGELDSSKIQFFELLLSRAKRNGNPPNYVMRTGHTGGLLAVVVQEAEPFSTAFLQQQDTYIAGGNLVLLYRHIPDMPSGVVSIDIDGVAAEVEVRSRGGEILGPGSIAPTGERCELHCPGDQVGLQMMPGGLIGKIVLARACTAEGTPAEIVARWRERW